MHLKSSLSLPKPMPVLMIQKHKWPISDIRQNCPTSTSLIRKKSRPTMKRYSKNTFPNLAILTQSIVIYCKACMTNIAQRHRVCPNYSTTCMTTVPWESLNYEASITLLNQHKILLKKTTKLLRMSKNIRLNFPMFTININKK